MKLNISNESNAFAKYSPIDEETELNIGKLNISFCKTKHPVETYAVKVTDGERTKVLIY